MGWKDGAAELDARMLQRPLPADAAAKLRAWLTTEGAPYTDGTGSHAVRYRPASWVGIRPWPSLLTDCSAQGSAKLSRAEVLAVARASEESADWLPALVASYVWGQGSNGYGPYRLARILSTPSLPAYLAKAVSLLADDGAVPAYRSMRGAVPGLGPAFFTKFLYFAGSALPKVPGPRPLILDQRIARTLRGYATRAGQEAGLDQPARLAGWLWSDGGWTPHRYDVYLQWMHAAQGQITLWPPARDLLELAIFSGCLEAGGPS
ncbi:hypothetical protein GCM10010377_77380 [Streptomyces viridiviolaceus]|uniref:Uncharacterized protein n=1 Tax=Streptomyces viridiviolaceus TaxID=68282 RepID=A0ABW2E528_9ACTN|nr:hypothetical protein [Streptomyces viridiviolaceus]GHB75522.1 hypothetical protein GCM10010377_77380 [Streptomyces viridiviolaceus]